MRKRIATMSLLLGLFLGLCLACTSKNTIEVEQPVTHTTSVENKETTQVETKTEEQEELKLNGTNPELYAASEETMLNMLNEPDQQRLQKAIQIVSNKIAETVDLYTEDDEINFDEWHAVYCEKVNGLTFTGILQLAEQLLVETKQRAQASLKEEIADLKANPTDDQEESLSFLQEELKKTKNLPTTIDTYVYNEECFL
jgi:biopolymer transport protein ExbD